jgi:ureidoacrylate peracid hydrolase
MSPGLKVPRRPDKKEHPMLTTLSDKVDPKHSALILIDVLNDFCADGGAMHRAGCDLSLVKRMMPRLVTLLEATRAAKVPVIWVRCAYNTPTNHYLSEVWMEQAHRKRNGAYTHFGVCEPGQWNGDFHQVKPLPEEVIVTKHRYGAFEGTDMDLVLRSRGIRSVIVTGVATNVCVETCCRQAFMKDYYVVLAGDCCATYIQAAHDATLFNVDQFFGEVATAEQIMQCWPAAESRLRAVS